MGKEKDIEKYQHLYSELKTELERIYITSKGDKFLEEMDALCAEAKIQKTKKAQRKRENRIMEIIDLLFEVLKKNNWGVFYKSEPMQTLSIQDDTPLLKINEVDADVLEKAAGNILSQLNTESLTMDNQDWKKEKHTTPHTPTDSNLTEN